MNTDVQITDSVLVAKYIKGDETALATLIDRYQSKIYRFIYSKVGDREVSEDIFQDTFIKVINTLKSGAYNEEGKFLSWVMRIAHNLVVDYFRNSKKIPIQRDTEEFSMFSIIADEVPNIESKLIDLQIKSDLERLVEELPTEQKEVLVMRIYQDLSFKEISEIKGISINTALGRMRYALMNIRKLIEKNKLILSQ
ncbi:MAG: sigma-70 family RNA polymerase sigma factor [Bacteroidota bacterium]|nr:sigma-70 family RNA polymerase sigma factor [Bacteroidota bacterium]